MIVDLTEGWCGDGPLDPCDESNQAAGGLNQRVIWRRRFVRVKTFEQQVSKSANPESRRQHLAHSRENDMRCHPV